MTASSNNNGRAYEYIFLVTLANSIRQYRGADVLEDSCYNASQKAWGKVKKAAQDDLRLGAEAAIQTLFDLEPMMVEPTDDKKLNQPSKTRKPVKTISVPQLPTEIVSLRFKPGSTTTVEMYLNNGWQLSFRIHNASTNVEASLKFDIQIIGLPLAYIYTVTCEWQ